MKKFLAALLFILLAHGALAAKMPEQLAQVITPGFFAYSQNCTATAALGLDSEEASHVAHTGTAVNPVASPITYSFTNTAGNVMFEGVVVTQSTVVPSVTYNGVSMTILKTFPNWDGQNDTLYWFWLPNPATGAHNVVVSWTGAIWNILFGAVTYHGADTNAQMTNTITATDAPSSTSTSASATLTGTTSGNAVLSLIGTGTSVGTVTSPTVTSALLNDNAGTASNNIAIGRQGTTGGSVTAGWAVGADYWGMLVGEVNQASGTGCATVPNATSYSLAGPSTGVVGTPTTNFTVASNGKLTSPVTITPNDSGEGGSFVPSSCPLAAGNYTSCNFTYTAAIAFTGPIGATNSASLINPTPVTLAVSGATVSGFVACDPATCSNALDTNPGTLAQPFATLTACKAAVEASLTVKTCIVRKGTYAIAATLVFNSASDSGQTWTYYALDGYNSATVVGGSTSSSTGLVGGFLIQANNFTLNGIAFANFSDYGVAVHGGAAFENLFGSVPAITNVTVQNILVYNIYDYNVFNEGAVVVEGQVQNWIVENSVGYAIADNGMRAGANDDSNTPLDNISNGGFIHNAVYQIGGAGTETSCYYIQDVNHTSTGLQISYNWGRDCGTGSGDQKRGLYRDEGASNITSVGNVIHIMSEGGVVFSGQGDSMNFISSGYSDVIEYNLLDLG